MTPPGPSVSYQNSMFEQLDSIVPKGVARLILDFEGRIYEGNLRDFVTNVYISDYQRSLGSFLRLYDVVNAQPLGKLEFFANFASVLGAAHPICLKQRKSKCHSLKFVQDCKLFNYTPPKTYFSVMNIKKLLAGAQVS